MSWHGLRFACALLTESAPQGLGVAGLRLTLNPKPWSQHLYHTARVPVLNAICAEGCCVLPCCAVLWRAALPPPDPPLSLACCPPPTALDDRELVNALWLRGCTDTHYR